MWFSGNGGIQSKAGLEELGGFSSLNDSMIFLSLDTQDPLSTEICSPPHLLPQDSPFSPLHSSFPDLSFQPSPKSPVGPCTFLRNREGITAGIYLHRAQNLPKKAGTAAMSIPVLPQSINSLSGKVSLSCKELRVKNNIKIQLKDGKEKIKPQPDTDFNSVLSSCPFSSHISTDLNLLPLKAS